MRHRQHLPELSPATATGSTYERNVGRAVSEVLEAATVAVHLVAVTPWSDMVSLSVVFCL